MGDIDNAAARARAEAAGIVLSTGDPRQFGEVAASAADVPALLDRLTVVEDALERLVAASEYADSIDEKFWAEMRDVVRAREGGDRRG